MESPFVNDGWTGRNSILIKRLRGGLTSLKFAFSEMNCFLEWKVPDWEILFDLEMREICARSNG
jgi:hypothetical protein